MHASFNEIVTNYPDVSEESLMNVVDPKNTV